MKKTNTNLSEKKQNIDYSKRAKSRVRKVKKDDEKKSSSSSTSKTDSKKKKDSGCCSMPSPPIVSDLDLGKKKKTKSVSKKKSLRKKKSPSQSTTASSSSSRKKKVCQGLENILLAKYNYDVNEKEEKKRKTALSNAIVVYGAKDLSKELENLIRKNDDEFVKSILIEDHNWFKKNYSEFF